MSKWSIFAGMVLAGFLLFQFDSGNITTTDVLSLVNKPTEIEENEIVEETADPVFGAIIENENVDSFLKTLKEKQEVNDFLIISDNESLQGRYEFAFRNSEKDLAEKLANYNKKLSIGSSYLAYYSDHELDGVLGKFEKKFPEASVTVVKVKNFVKDADLEAFAELIDSNFDNDTVVLSVVKMPDGLAQNVLNFHDELKQNIFRNFDKMGLKQVSFKNSAGTFVLMSYLEMIGAMRTDGSLDSPTFYAGEAMSDNRELTILAFGDMMLGRHVRTLMNENGMDYIFENIRGEDGNFFNGADVIFANLEGPILGKGRSGGTAMVFAFNEDVAPFLKRHGFNLLSLSNNHAMDMGEDGRKATVEAMDNAGLGWCGHPSSESDAESIHYGKVGEKSYAFLCFQDITDGLNLDAAVEQISELSQRVDYVIVSIHWGKEYYNRADRVLQVEPGHAFVDAGADVVIGHHPHVVQNFEVYKDRLIFYSLGNFVFDQYWSIGTQEELAIGLVLGGDNDNFSSKVYLFPMKSELSQSRLMNEEERKKWTEQFIKFGDYDEKMQEMIRNGLIELN